MAVNANPLLSICIPTYNRSKLLRSCLSSIFKQLDDDMNVEIIVSNNNSTDDTSDVVQNFFHDSRFKYFEQAENLGATKNFFKVVNEYSCGEFCWIVGDDDFLLQGSLSAILNLIKEKKDTVDYFYATVIGIDILEYNKHEFFDTTMVAVKNRVKKLEYKHIDKFEELIAPEYSIIFLGELMASIFRREYWVKQEIDIEGENLERLETTYPHSMVLAKAFFGKKAVYIKTPLLLALDGAREWVDKLGYILIEQVKNLIDFYAMLGLPKKIKRECYKSYLSMTFKYFLNFLISRNSKYRDKVSLSRYIFFMLSNPVLSMSFFVRATGNKIIKAMPKKSKIGI